MDFGTAHQIAQGKWHDILPQLGISEKYLTGKHGPCPICSGKDRFRFDDKNGRGSWICNECGAGDGFSLVAKIKGIDVIKAKMTVTPLLGSATKKDFKKPESHASFRTAAERFWKSTGVVLDDSPVALYLKKRLGSFSGGMIRQGQTNHPLDKGQNYSVMAAKINGPDGKGVSVHKTYLLNSGEKAPLDPNKVMMPGPLVQGASIWLTEPAEHLGLAEGIETALSATLLHNVPTWAAISATMMRTFEPPAVCKKLTIFADNDANYVGQAAAFELARRLVITRQMQVQVMIPDRIGDWNDVLQRR